MDARPGRLAEVLGMLPLLHVPIESGKRLTVAVAGSHAGLLIDEVRRWPDVGSILTPFPVVVKDTRLRQTGQLSPGTVDVMLLSPGMGPMAFLPALRPGGLVQVSTYDANLWGPLRTKLAKDAGAAVPWRENLPHPIYGALGRLGNAPPKRCRRPPKAAVRLNEQFLPCLFTFGKDELRLLNPPGDSAGGMGH